ncbi:MAG: chorismate mutase [Candidatus Gracilibacteria bacterium]|nr:chorismate mutase [Candidatus Gracilibacteria bacterium]MDQ7023506.1 chorismate mutase [Candidatus Gracilibacteria bacterium]
MELDEYLKNFREQIDTLDHEIIYLLSRRFIIVEQIGLIKKDIGAESIQPKRWEELMYKVLEEAKDKHLSEDLVKKIWNLIHKESLKIEK